MKIPEILIFHLLTFKVWWNDENRTADLKTSLYKENFSLQDWNFLIFLDVFNVWSFTIFEKENYFLTCYIMWKLFSFKNSKIELYALKWTQYLNCYMILFYEITTVQNIDNCSSLYTHAINNQIFDMIKKKSKIFELLVVCEFCSFTKTESPLFSVLCMKF